MIERLQPPAADARTGFNPENPYVGPRPFKRGERLYGRARESRDVLDLLFSERIVLVYSPSGAGKTSLLEAAIIPCAEKEGFTVFPSIRLRPAVGTQEPRLGSGNPLVAAALMALSAPEHNPGAIPPAPAHTLRSYLDEECVRLGLDRSGSLLLVFDQFEEVLTTSDPGALEGFLAELTPMLRDRRIFAILSMREEHLGQLDRFLAFFPTRLSARYRVGFLDQRAAISAITGPACDHGVDFPAHLGQRLVEDLGTTPGDSPDAGVVEVSRDRLVEPLHIQLRCHALWESQVERWKALPPAAPRVVPDDAVTRPEALDLTLGAYYARIVRSVAAEVGIAEQELRNWVGTKLITPRGQRDLVLRDSSGPKLAAAADRLVDYLLVRRDERRGMVWYELAHDRFVRAVRHDNERLREHGARRKQKLMTAGASFAVVLLAVLILGGFTFRKVTRSWWEAAWLVLDLQKELQSRTYNEVPRQIVPLSSVPILPDEEAVPRPSRPATFTAREREAERAAAQAFVRAALARGGNPERAAYTLTLPANTPPAALRDLRALGYRVVTRGTTEVAANSLIFADDVPVAEIRLIALAYASSGAEIMRIRRFRTAGHSRDVTFDFDPDIMDWPPYTVRQMEALRPLPYPNDTPPEPEGSE